MAMAAGGVFPCWSNGKGADRQDDTPAMETGPGRVRAVAAAAPDVSAAGPAPAPGTTGVPGEGGRRVGGRFLPGPPLRGAPARPCVRRAAGWRRPCPRRRAGGNMSMTPIFRVLLPTEGREAHGRPGRIVVLEATKRGRPWPKWIVCPSWVAGRV